MQKKSVLGPFFLGVGPPKTATSWIYKSLSQHPNTDFPPVKEIGYLWEKSNFPDRNYMSRLLNNHWYYRAIREYLLHSIRGHFRDLVTMKIDKDTLLWDLHYALLPHTDSWYSKLFNQHLLSGDITPKYCELNESDISEIQRRQPELKIIISVRDPVERDWSRAKMNLCMKRKRQPDTVPELEWIRHFDEPVQSSANDYKALYERWSKFFGEDNIHIIFFDEVQQNSWDVFNRLCQFLNLQQLPDSFMSHIIQPANVGIKNDIPEPYEKYLFSKHIDKMQRFANLFPHNHYPQEWIRKHEDSLQTYRL